ncbi:class I glutamine amidotransferase-like protein [Triangularia setosa]|uniref:Class I glutamine amidotransferase-like protein n=1 Tax=Triangularia setosa TaxID=2587417 RepID=A0AAN6WBY0_9PEZI|nr:class I glutamine amidotransferase-like protein [Podospora setosa]
MAPHSEPEHRDEVTAHPKGQDAPIIRMMVLETDEPHKETKKIPGKTTFGEILHKHFTNAGKAHNPPLGIETDRWFVIPSKGGTMPKYKDFEGYDALLITGSVYDAHGDDPWTLDLLKLLRELWQNHPKMHFSGVCFGHQLLCRLLGAEVRPSPKGDWELGHSRVELTPVGQKLFRTDDDHVHLHQMHQDHVVAPPTIESAKGLLPKGTKVHVWGKSDHTEVQGVYIKGKMFTTQAHLAFDEEMVKRQIEMRVKAGSIGDKEAADQAAETADLEHDGEVAAGAILRFFHDEDEDID